MAKLPGLKVTVDDEGKYGPSTYSDDWKEAYEAGRKPTYTPAQGASTTQWPWRRKSASGTR